jgi:hypothetical protein
MPPRPRLAPLRPFAFPAALLAGGVATGGLPGLVLGFIAALLGLDRAFARFVDVSGWGMLAAERRFVQLSRERRRAELARRLHLGVPSHLAHLAMDGGWAAIAERERRGVQPIRIDSIVGSVERHKAEAFDREFRPPSFTRGRWTQMCLAAQRGVAMPPIAVYRVGDEHYLRDGHHRVSVARALGAREIDADVVELRPPA